MYNNIKDIFWVNRAIFQWENDIQMIYKMCLQNKLDYKRLCFVFFCVLILKLFISMFSEYLYHWKEIDSADVNRWKSITFLKIIHLHVNLFDTVIAKKAAFKKPRETWMNDFHFIYQLKVKADIHKVFLIHVIIATFSETMLDILLD